MEENKDLTNEVDAEKADTHESTEPVIETAENEVQTLKDTIIRQMADSENLRKRLEKEKEESVRYSNVKFAKDLLPVIDNFERAIASSSVIMDKIKSDKDINAVIDGVVLCEKEIISLLKKYGIEKICISDNEQFDPQKHQAMCEVNSENHEEGCIVEVFQAGYIYHDRLLRPSVVSVSKKS